MTGTDDNELSWISGLLSVQAAVSGGNREVWRILVQDDRFDGDTARLQRAARERGVPLERVPEATLRATAGADAGPVIAEVGQRRFVALPDLLAAAEPAALFMLDGVEDPYNLGQALRSLYAAGATGVILRSHNPLTAVDTVLRASAGTADLIPAAVVDSPEEVITLCRRQGVTVLAAIADDAVPMYDVDLRRSFCLLIGGEKRGLSRATVGQSDERVAIPYGRPACADLGAAAAAAVLGFEMARQRRRS
jgi:23S rRNA (guanosine2251-2'-O)-methyltransferase